MAGNECGDPYLDEGMHGFIRNTAVKEFWRVAGWYDTPADLVQDGYLCYCKCKRYIGVGKLPTVPTLPVHRKHMMALVKTTFLRHIKYTIAGQMQWGKEVPVSQLVRDGAEDADPWETLLPKVSEVATLSALLRSAPAELQQLMELLAGDGTEVLGFRRSRLYRQKTPGGGTRIVRRKKALRETTNQYYCRLLGIVPGTDVVGRLREFLSGQTV
jgi:hypothetical protein